MAIEVTEADRDAAAAHYKSVAGGEPLASWVNTSATTQAFARHRTESIAAYLDALIASLPDGAVEAGVEAIDTAQGPDWHLGVTYDNLRAAITAALQHMKEKGAPR